jgi:hypothetical protein
MCKGQGAGLGFRILEPPVFTGHAAGGVEGGEFGGVEPVLDDEGSVFDAPQAFTSG